MNANTPAYPHTHESWYVYGDTLKQAPPSGLTKRELIAAMALQGLCANQAIVDNNHATVPPFISDLSVKMADALLARLNHP